VFATGEEDGSAVDVEAAVEAAGIEEDEGET